MEKTMNVPISQWVLQRVVDLLEQVVEAASIGLPPADPHNPHDRAERLRSECLVLIKQLYDAMDTRN
jgi:hypothetical protein